MAKSFAAFSGSARANSLSGIIQILLLYGKRRTPFSVKATEKGVFDCC